MRSKAKRPQWNTSPSLPGQVLCWLLADLWRTVRLSSLNTYTRWTYATSPGGGGIHPDSRVTNIGVRLFPTLIPNDPHREIEFAGQVAGQEYPSFLSQRKS